MSFRPSVLSTTFLRWSLQFLWIDAVILVFTFGRQFLLNSTAVVFFLFLLFVQNLLLVVIAKSFKVAVKDSNLNYNPFFGNKINLSLKAIQGLQVSLNLMTNFRKYIVGAPLQIILPTVRKITFYKDSEMININLPFWTDKDVSSLTKYIFENFQGVENRNDLSNLDKVRIDPKGIEKSNDFSKTSPWIYGLGVVILILFVIAIYFLFFNPTL